MGPDDRLANGTYYLRYTFYHNMRRQENGVDFACHLVQEKPTMSVTASNSLPLIVNCKFVCLTQLSRMEFPTLINWTSPFPFSWLLGGIFHFHSNLNPFKPNAQGWWWGGGTLTFLIRRLGPSINCLPQNMSGISSTPKIFCTFTLRKYLKIHRNDSEN